MTQKLQKEFEFWFDVKDHIDSDWFERYIDHIETFSNNPQEVRIEVWMNPSITMRRVIFYNSSEARIFIANNWINIEEITILYPSGDIKYSLINQQHQHLKVRFSETWESQPSDIAANFNKLFSLTPSKPLPYKHRRSSIEFDIGQWSPKEFAAGVKAIAELIGPNPYLENAYVKSFDGEIERLTPFVTLDDFYRHVDRRASTFGEATVQLRARSTTIGISVPSDHKKLRIRTSIPPEEVDGVIDAWPNSLKLKQIKAVDTGNLFTGPNSIKIEEGRWVKLGVPIVIAMITSFSVTSFITLKRAIWPEHTLVLASPKQEGKNSVWTGKQLEVDWYLQPEKPSFRNISKDVPASVSLTNQDGISKKFSGKPPLMFDVLPGNYNLAVNVEQLPTIHLYVKVE